VFHWDGGLKLTKADLAIDFRRRQARAFISHAHTDHMARHEHALCTPQTAALYRFRLGERSVREMPYREPIDWGGLRLTTYPAGHCLGSAMLLAEDGHESLLYTGDFKLAQPATCEAAEGFAVLQHRKVHEITRIYESFGVEFGRSGLYRGRLEPDTVLVVPPRTRRLKTDRREVRFAVTGWARDERAKYRLRVDHAVALSDHADYDDLLEAVGRVDAHKVLCTHGPESFVDRLREAGFDAHPLGRPTQRKLF